MVTLECHGNENSPKLKDFLTNLFLGSWRVSSGTPRDQTALSRCCDRTFLRTLSANLWSELLELLVECGVVGKVAPSFGIGRTTIEIISSIHSIVDLVPEFESVGWFPVEFWHLIELVNYCLALVGLVISVACPNDLSGLSFYKEADSVSVRLDKVAACGQFAHFKVSCEQVFHIFL